MLPPRDKNLLAAEGYIELGMFEDALAELEIADRTFSNRMEVAHRKLDIFIEQEHWKDALPYGEALCDLDPDSPGIFIQYAYVLRETGQIREARATLLDGPDGLQEIGTYHYNLGCYEALLDHPKRALAHLLQAFSLEPELRQTAESDTDLDTVRSLLPPMP